MSKRKYLLSDDPHYSREVERYEKPIPSREYVIQFLADRGSPATQYQICQAFSLDSPEQRDAMKRRLRAMENQGQVIRNRRGAYGLVEKMDLIPGRVCGHPDGYGFLTPDQGGDDFYLSPRQMRKVIHGDRVLAHVTGIDHRGRREAEIVELLDSQIHQVVGRLHVESGVFLVVPDNKRITQPIVIADDKVHNAKANQMVVVQLLRAQSSRGTLMGEVTSILDLPEGYALQTAIAIHNHQLPYEWPSEVLDEVAHFTSEVSEKDKEDRVDLRDLPLVTIDGEDAKDFDDAVYVEKAGRGGYRLVVAIADVSHYVRLGTVLDEEALRRGTSIYFPAEVIPMLPPILSNELCSLKPQVDRLALVADMIISRRGQLKKYKFYPAVIRSQMRFTYNQVAEILVDRNVQARQQFEEFIPHLQNLYELYSLLDKKRKERGAIEFESNETIFKFDKNQQVREIIPFRRNDAHKMIEECMIMANVAAAEYLTQAKIPLLYRVHEVPSPEKLERLQEFLSEFRLRLLAKGKPTPAVYQHVLSEVRGKPYAHLVNTVLLRSLSQAVYAPKNMGHFGLALPVYAHFTSPIRRYPDLLVHRAIHWHLSKEKGVPYAYDFNRLVYLGQQCSAAERRADEASWDVEARLKCEYMRDKLNEEYDGVITSVAGFGFFVELTSLYVEGLVHVTKLKNDYYHYNPVTHRIMGERHGQCYRLGDQVRVRVIHVDVEAKKIDLELINTYKKSKKRK